MRPNSTHLQHRSFSIDRRSTISAHEFISSPSKSFLSKSSKHVKQKQQKNKLDPMSSSVPIEIYFNPQIRKQYVSKVIDSFFTESQMPTNLQNPQKRNSFVSYKKPSLRNRLLEWKKKTKPIKDFQLAQSNKFIRSSPKKSIISDLSEQKSFTLVNQDNQTSQLQKSQIKINSKSFIENAKSISILKSKSRVIRPLSEQKKKPIRNLFFDDNKSIECDSYSVFLNQSSLSPQESFRKQVKIITQSNNYFEEFNIFQDGILVSKMRRYINEGNPLLIRQEKLSKKGVKTLWKHCKFPNTLEYPTLKSIKDQLTQEFKYGQGYLDSYIQIYPKPYYNQLFLNKNEELIDVITSMTKFIINNKGNILTGTFQIQNLYKLKEKEFLLKDLGSSAIVQSIKIRDKNIVYLYPPYFKDEDRKGKWLVRPEYLAPQVLDSLVNSQFQWISQNPEAVIASEIWSLGCMLLEILTLIPLNSDFRCRVKSNPQNLRRGFLSIKFNQKFVDLQTLHKKQKSLQTMLNKSLENQLKNVPVQSEILTILRKMLIYEPSKRIKAQQILSDLKK